MNSYQANLSRLCTHLNIEDTSELHYRCRCRPDMWWCMCCCWGSICHRRRCSWALSHTCTFCSLDDTACMFELLCCRRCHWGMVSGIWMDQDPWSRSSRQHRMCRRCLCYRHPCTPRSMYSWNNEMDILYSFQCHWCIWWCSTRMGRYQRMSYCSWCCIPHN
jgi:hypothetical protein